MPVEPTTKRQQKRAERARLKDLRAKHRRDMEWQRQQQTRRDHPERPSFRGERWMPIPEVEGYEVNQRGTIRKTASHPETRHAR